MGGEEKVLRDGRHADPLDLYGPNRSWQDHAIVCHEGNESGSNRHGEACRLPHFRKERSGSKVSGRVVEAITLSEVLFRLRMQSIRGKLPVSLLLSIDCPFENLSMYDEVVCGVSFIWERL
jgi:hypothetical protein